MLFELTPPSLAVLPLHGTDDAVVYAGDAGTGTYPPPHPRVIIESVVYVGDLGSGTSPPPRPR